MANSSLLLCTEKLDNRCAERDPVIFTDQRVLNNLLHTERTSLINKDYFSGVQTDITPAMRRILVNWMMEVCEVLGCENPVFPLAVRMVDLYLAKCDTVRSHLQLLGTVCILVASKVRQVHPIASETLIYYTDYSVTTKDVMQYEMLLLQELNWNILHVTAADFVEHILTRVPWAKENPLIRRHAHLLLQLCCADHESIRVRPSTVASGCLIAATRGLRIPSFSDVTDHVCALAHVKLADALAVEERVEALVREEETRHIVNVQRPSPITSSDCNSSLKPSSTVPLSGNGSVPLDILIDEDEEAMDQTSQPVTPTDVQDIHF